MGNYFSRKCSFFAVLCVFSAACDPTLDGVAYTRLVDPFDPRQGEFANTPSLTVAQTGVEGAPRFRVVSAFQRFDRTMFSPTGSRRPRTSSVFVSSSTNVGASWSAPLAVRTDPNEPVGPSALGHPSLTIDPTPDGSVFYARPARPSTVWLAATSADIDATANPFASTNRVFVSRSLDGGQTFTQFSSSLAAFGVNRFASVVSMPSIQGIYSRVAAAMGMPMPARALAFTSKGTESAEFLCFRYVFDTPSGGYRVAGNQTQLPEAHEGFCSPEPGMNRVIVRAFGDNDPVLFWETRAPRADGRWAVQYFAGYVSLESVSGDRRLVLHNLPRPNAGRTTIATAALPVRGRSTGARLDTHFDVSLPGRFEVPVGGGKTVQLYQGRHVYMVWVGAEREGEAESVWYQRGTLSSVDDGSRRRVEIEWDFPVRFTDRGQGSIPYYPTIATLGEEVVLSSDATPTFDRPAITFGEFDASTGGVRLLARRERRELPTALPLAERWPVGNLSRASRSVDARGQQPICSTLPTTTTEPEWGSFNASVAVPDITTNRAASSIITAHTESDVVGAACQRSETTAFIQRVSATRWQVSDLAGLAP